MDVPETIRMGLEAAARAISIDPNLADGYKARALNLRFAGDLRGAREALMRAIEVNPRHTPSLVNLAVDAFTSADLAGAERFVRRTLVVDPQEAFGMSWLALLCGFSRREDEVIALTHAIRGLSDEIFYLNGVYSMRAAAHLSRAEVDAAVQAMQDGVADKARPESMRVIEAMVAAQQGRASDARRMLEELADVSGHGASSLLLMAQASVRLGDLDRARDVLCLPSLTGLAPVIARLLPSLHPVLDLTPFAPRRSDATLVWPLEAPMLDARVHALFREVRIESGLPQGSEIRTVG